jgi:beta-fructofuranosidase
VTFDYQGEVLPAGSSSDDDLHCYTGSIIAAGGVHHLFYTAYNQHIVDPEAGGPSQSVRHAVSNDLLHWTKLPGRVSAPRGVYDPLDWRDPFVFRSPTGDGFVMLIATRTLTGPGRRRGVIARAVSDDLETWNWQQPLMGNRFFMHECPDLFRLGETWYLLFSEFSDRFVTRYRRSRSLDGPWCAGPEDALDGRGFYAAKTTTDGGRRYAFGWIPTKRQQVDGGAWEWAGDLAVHELAQRPDGTLASRLPAPLRESFTTQLTLPGSTPVSGNWKIQDGNWKAEALDSAAQLLVADLPPQCKVTVEVRFQQDTRECGVILRATAEPEAGYYLRLEPDRDRLVLDTWPRTVPGEHQWQLAGDKPHAIETERHTELAPETMHHLEILIDGSIGVAYLDDEIAMSFRMYEQDSGALGIFVADGSATFTNIEVAVRPQYPEMAR